MIASPAATKTAPVEQSRRNIGGSILPSSEPRILAPVNTAFGVLQIRPLPDLDEHGLFLTHGRGTCVLALKANGYSLYALIERMVSGDQQKVREQVEYILDTGGVSKRADSIIEFMQVDPEHDTIGEQAETPPVEQPTLHLQSVGRVPAKPARDFKVGEFTLWNFGSTSEIIEIAAKGKTQLAWKMQTMDGKIWDRTVKADRLVAIASQHIR